MDKSIRKVIENGSCCGCGACVALDESKETRMIDTDYGPIPSFGLDANISNDFSEICPSIGINYPNLYKYYLAATFIFSKIFNLSRHLLLKMTNLMIPINGSFNLQNLNFNITFISKKI
jgi:hypothetical protein